MVGKLHHDTMLPRRMPIGREESIEAMSVDDLRRFYKRWYKPNNMTLYLVGDVDVEYARTVIHDCFGHEERAEVPRHVSIERLYRGPNEDVVIFTHEQLHQFSTTICQVQACTSGVH